jgi:ketosteroid isomerase-like protein
MSSVADLIHRYFAAYESKDRKSLEALLRDDFTFSSPLDDNISREKYMERCWPNSEHLRAFHIEKLFAEGNEGFVTYECERTDGGMFRNTEFFQTDGDKIRHVDVYFGSDTGE